MFTLGGFIVLTQVALNSPAPWAFSIVNLTFLQRSLGLVTRELRSQWSVGSFVGLKPYATQIVEVKRFGNTGDTGDKKG